MCNFITLALGAEMRLAQQPHQVGGPSASQDLPTQFLSGLLTFGTVLTGFVFRPDGILHHAA